MKRNLTEIVYILDQSGSMASLADDTIGGFNAMLKEQKEKEGEVLLSTVLFDTRSKIVHDRIPLQDAEPMSYETYRPAGCTALLDAMGDAITHIASIHKYARPEDVPEKTLFLIMTDGLENSSTHYDYAKIRTLVERQMKEYGWEFMFMGANMDAIEYASKFGLGDRHHAVSYRSDARGTRLNHHVMSDIVSTARFSSTRELLRAQILGADLFSEIREDYEHREDD